MTIGISKALYKVEVFEPKGYHARSVVPGLSMEDWSAMRAEVKANREKLFQYLKANKQIKYRDMTKEQAEAQKEKLEKLTGLKLQVTEYSYLYF